jgi:hypothetical protein
VPSLLICCLCGKSFRTRAERANHVSHTISGVLHSWMRLSFVCLVPMDLRGKTQGTLPQVEGPQDGDKSAGPSAVFGCCAPERHGRSAAPRECRQANRSRREQRSRPMPGSTGLPERGGVFRTSQALTSLVSPGCEGPQPKLTYASHRSFGARRERHPRRQSCQLFFRSP